MSAESHESQESEAYGDVAVDRRRSHRETVVAIGRLTPVDEGRGLRAIQVLVTDVSLHGCDFKCAIAPEAGTLYRIELTLGPLALTSRLRVIRLHPRCDATFAAGAEFI